MRKMGVDWTSPFKRWSAMQRLESINTRMSAIGKQVSSLTFLSLISFHFSRRMQNRLRITELKHEMANLQANKLQSQLKSFIKVSRWERDVCASLASRLILFLIFQLISFSFYFPFDFFIVCKYLRADTNERRFITALSLIDLSIF